MTIDTRQAVHPDAVRSMDTATLRRHFLIETLFSPDRIHLTLSHLDRVVIGGIVPVTRTLALEAEPSFKAACFLERRELGVINLGGPGVVRTDGVEHALAKREAVYVAMGTQQVSFRSDDPDRPARFYLVSAPAHARFETVRLPLDKAKTVSLGEPAKANVRTIYQLIHPEVVQTCQLVMGTTVLESGSIWNTMPCHVHDRRMEAYCYYDLPEDARVFHFMGEPDQTRHMVVADGQALLSPGWSIHSGVGTQSYAFVWAMAGENQTFTDMDHVAMADLR
ncbi:5-dehydro-4-deoxy-D-glucuronate isomerase [Geminicoccus roseus]|uniref:5-dehydro-4-deoxy-D-glucuronate isomerase n=1 Tax=Geminicoccus roseus TaxID=404900 RepID=UPI0004882998|nr:5-dehydro-4-deoxy-D-glucuronate isomerase [Geminicoccus roseus]